MITFSVFNAFLTSTLLSPFRGHQSARWPAENLHLVWQLEAFASNVFYPGPIASAREGKCSPTPSLSFSYPENCPINLIGPNCNSRGSPSSPNPHDPVLQSELSFKFILGILSLFWQNVCHWMSLCHLCSTSCLLGEVLKLFPLINDNTQSSLFKNCTQEHDLLFMHSLIHFSVSECLLHASHCASGLRLCIEHNR